MAHENGGQAQTSPADIFKLLPRNSDNLWTLSRSIQSLDTPSLSGSATGSATFTTLRTGQLLYHEKGTYIAHAGPALGPSLKAPFEKKYIWDRQDNRLSVHFVKPKQTSDTGDEEEEEVDYLFHTLTFRTPEPSSRSPQDVDTILLKATGGHLCINDMYESSYTFYIKDLALASWEMKHVVKGPKKDQIIETRFS